MRIIGLDAAADLANFGCVVCRHGSGALELEDRFVLSNPAGEQALASYCGGAERTLIAIDAPLGWPAPLAESLALHQAGEPLIPIANELFRRETDRWIKLAIGRQSLDIGADRIARAAWQALKVLSRLRANSGLPIPLAWRPDFEESATVIEVYPAATLAANGLNPIGYKDASGGIAARRRLSGGVSARAPWLSDLTADKVDIFDAGLCAVAGADFLDGLACPPGNLALARKEGWIWVRSRLQESATTTKARKDGRR